jgi:hypothetical protein
MAGRCLQRRENHDYEHGDEECKGSWRHATLPNSLSPVSAFQICGCIVARYRGHLWLWKG